MRDRSVLMLLLHIGKDAYAVDCDRVVEVVPLVMVKEIPHSPPHLAGVFNYRGRIVPVVDLCVVLAGRRCAARLSSRIVLVSTAAGADRGDIVGLLAERVTETVSREAHEFEDLRDDLEVVPYLGGISTRGEGMIQELRVGRLLAHAVPRQLLATRVGDGGGADGADGDADRPEGGGERG